jgi:hypothetical protein
MPPLILWVIGIAGAAVAGRWVYREGRRINAELHPQQHVDDVPTGTLERDPRTGIYRPK